jgi:methanogenic corrinoid protein MtbC1
MTALIAQGISAAEAAGRAIADEPGVETVERPVLDDLATRLERSLDAFDGEGAHAAFDRLLASVSVEALLEQVVLPYLHRLGERWERGEVSVAQEHFASNLVRGRLLALARSWDRGAGPRALIACTEGELHDLPLICFGLALRGHGWRISYLGADTPVASVIEAARTLAPDAVVVSGTVSGIFEETAVRLREVAVHAPLYVSGAAATEQVAERASATFLNHDLVLAAETLARRR